MSAIRHRVKRRTIRLQNRKREVQHQGELPRADVTLMRFIQAQYLVVKFDCDAT